MAAFFDWIMGFIYSLASAVLAFLPDSPFQSAGIKEALDTFQGLMGNINYFIPFGQMLTITGVYIAAVLIWYGVRWILRIAKYIE